MSFLVSGKIDNRNSGDLRGLQPLKRCAKTLSSQISVNTEDIIMSLNQEVSINLDGVKVLGEITYRSEADISIRITKPYMGLSNGCHIPYFSRPIHSFLTDYGDKMAENLLKYLYELNWFMEKNRKFIKLQLSLHFHNGDYSDWECQNRFFDSTFPFIVPIDTRDEVLRILNISHA